MDAIELLKADHRAVESLFAQYESAPSPVEKHEIVKQVIRELSIHAAIEEQLLYPMMRFKLDDGNARANHAIDDHQGVKRLLADLEKLDTTSEQFYEKVRELMAAIRHHVPEEEGEIFTELSDKVPADQREKLGTLMEKAKSLVPTHPHPMVPGTATAQLLAGPWASIADHIRDLVDGIRKAG